MGVMLIAGAWNVFMGIALSRHAAHQRRDCCHHAVYPGAEHVVPDTPRFRGKPTHVSPQVCFLSDLLVTEGVLGIWQCSGQSSCIFMYGQTS